MKIAVFASTNGSNLPSFFENAEKCKIDCIFLTNKNQCGAMGKAKDFGIPSFFVDATGKTREEFDMTALEILEKNQVEYVFLIGYMRIVSSVLTQKFAGKMFNIHPSLLPAFAGGMDNDVHTCVLAKGCKISGATLHEVSDEVDCGKIVMQKSVEISDDQTPETLKKKVQQKEQEMLAEMLEHICDSPK